MRQVEELRRPSVFVDPRMTELRPGLWRASRGHVAVGAVGAVGALEQQALIARYGQRHSRGTLTAE
jgi:hypothetical protein